MIAPPQRQRVDGESGKSSFKGIGSMADKKERPGSKAGAASDDTAAASGKKPKPLLDLKATEVRGGSVPETSPAPASTLKGAPGWKQPDQGGKSDVKPRDGAEATGKPQPAKDETAGTRTSAGGASTGPAGAASSKPGATSAGGRTGNVDTISTAATTGGGGASSAKPAAKTSDAKPKAGDDKKPTPQAAAKSATKAPAAKRSGGGFFSTMSHLAAGIVGGGVALFAAEPLGQQFGFALTQPPQMPAALERRLAALEAQPADRDDGTAAAVRKEVDQLADRVATTQARLAELDQLAKQVTSLAADIEKVQVAAASTAPAPDGGADRGDSSAETGELRNRLTKLESTMATLSSATASDGEPSALASLAKMSARFADLESSLNNQLGTLRKSLMEDVDKRLTSTTEATAKAVAGTERLDRELAEVKTDTARLDQRSAVLKTASDKLTAKAGAIGEQAAELKVELDALKGDLQQQLAKVARPDDVAQAIAPVSKKIASLEQNLGAVVASESARKANAERIVLSLELSNLKRVLDRGVPYGSELAEVKKIAGDAIDVGSLEAHKSTGVPSGQELTRQFSSVAYKIINAQNAPQDDTRINRLWAAARSIVQVRRTDIPAEEKTAEAAVARIEKRLKDGDMSGALALAEKLPDRAKTPAGDWIGKLAARASVDRAIAKIEDQLKASLGGAGGQKS